MEKDKIIQEFRDDIDKILNQLNFNKVNENVGVLKDTKNFDPDDPEVIVSGFGSWNRSALRMAIVNRLEGLLRTAKTAANTDGPAAYNMYNNMRNLLDSKSSVIFRLIQAELDVAEQLETIRRKGGRRNFIIPKQK